MKKKIVNENKKIGSVMLPKKWSIELLNMIDKDCFGNNEYVFFEPCCGTGNIVTEIINKQFYSFLDKIEKEKDYSKMDQWGNIAVIQTISNLFAIDINEEYINICRKRVMKQLNFILYKVHNSGKCIHNKYFMDILEKAVNYHVHQNEMLSCLKDDYKEAEKAASKTRLSKEAFKKLGHAPINFQISYFDSYVK